MNLCLDLNLVIKSTAIHIFSIERCFADSLTFETMVQLEQQLLATIWFVTFFFFSVNYCKMKWN